MPWHTNRVRIAELGAALEIAAGVAGEDRPRRAPARPDRGRRGARGRRRRRLLGDAAQAQRRSARCRRARAPSSPAATRPCSRQRSSRSTSARPGPGRPSGRRSRARSPTREAQPLRSRGALEGLEVDAARMRANLDLTGGQIVAERIALLLTDRLGRTAARALVRDASLRADATGRPLGRGARRPRHGPDGRGDPGRARADDVSRLGRRCWSTGRSRATTPERDGVKLHHVVDGPAGAPALVLSSSLGTTLAMWEPQIAALAERFRVVRYDRRGHGRSPVPPGPTTIDDLGGDLLELLDELGLERVSFCGLSLGGVEGMWLAVNAPERVDAPRALLHAARVRAPAGLDRPRRHRARGRRERDRRRRARPLVPAVLPRRPTRRSSTRFRAMLVATPPEGYAACCEVLATSTSVRASGRSPRRRSSSRARTTRS